MFWNSAYMVVPIIAGQTLVAALAAYAFGKLNFRGRETDFLVYLLTMLMPFQVTLVPNYIMADKLGLLNSANAIILPGIFAAFGVFMLGSSCCIFRMRISKPPRWTAQDTCGSSAPLSCR